MQSLILATANQDRSFHVFCDGNKFSIGCALRKGQCDTDDAERIVCYQSHQLQEPMHNYPKHDRVLLIMKYALVKLRAYLSIIDPLLYLQPIYLYALP